MRLATCAYRRLPDDPNDMACFRAIVCSHNKFKKFLIHSSCVLLGLCIFDLEKAKICWIHFLVTYLVLLQNSLLPQLRLRYFFNSQYSQAVGMKNLPLPQLINVQAEKYIEE